MKLLRPEEVADVLGVSRSSARPNDRGRNPDGNDTQRQAEENFESRPRNTRALDKSPGARRATKIGFEFSFSINSRLNPWQSKK